VSIPPQVPDTSHDPTLDDLSAHEFDVPCGARNKLWHPVVGTGPARWVIRFTPCCRSRIVFFCDGCKDLLLTAPDMHDGTDGHAHAPARSAVRSMDTL
jgi:hypothetical protein